MKYYGVKMRPRSGNWDVAWAYCPNHQRSTTDINEAHRVATQYGKASPSHEYWVEEYE